MVQASTSNTGQKKTTSQILSSIKSYTSGGQKAVATTTSSGKTTYSAPQTNSIGAATKGEISGSVTDSKGNVGYYKVENGQRILTNVAPPNTNVQQTQAQQQAKISQQRILNMATDTPQVFTTNRSENAALIANRLRTAQSVYNPNYRSQSQVNPLLRNAQPTTTEGGLVRFEYGGQVAYVNPATGKTVLGGPSTASYFPEFLGIQNQPATYEKITAGKTSIISQTKGINTEPVAIIKPAPKGFSDITPTEKSPFSKMTQQERVSDLGYRQFIFEKQVEGLQAFESNLFSKHYFQTSRDIAESLMKPISPPSPKNSLEKLGKEYFTLGIQSVINMPVVVPYSLASTSLKIGLTEEALGLGYDIRPAYKEDALSPELWKTFNPKTAEGLLTWTFVGIGAAGLGKSLLTERALEAYNYRGATFKEVGVKTEYGVNKGRQIILTESKPSWGTYKGFTEISPKGIQNTKIYLKSPRIPILNPLGDIKVTEFSSKLKIPDLKFTEPIKKVSMKKEIKMDLGTYPELGQKMEITSKKYTSYGVDVSGKGRNEMFIMGDFQSVRKAVASPRISEESTLFFDKNLGVQKERFLIDVKQPKLYFVEEPVIPKEDIFRFSKETSSINAEGISEIKINYLREVRESIFITKQYDRLSVSFFGMKEIGDNLGISTRGETLFGKTLKISEVPNRLDLATPKMSGKFLSPRGSIYRIEREVSPEVTTWSRISGKLKGKDSLFLKRFAESFKDVGKGKPIKSYAVAKYINRDLGFSKGRRYEWLRPEFQHFTEKESVFSKTKKALTTNVKIAVSKFKTSNVREVFGSAKSVLKQSLPKYVSKEKTKLIPLTISKSVSSSKIGATTKPSTKSVFKVESFQNVKPQLKSKAFSEIRLKNEVKGSVFTQSKINTETRILNRVRTNVRSESMIESKAAVKTETTVLTRTQVQTPIRTFVKRNPFRFNVPTNKVTPRLFPPFPPRSWEGIQKIGRKGLPKFSRSFRYVASVRAGQQNIFARKRPRVITNIGFRPLIRTRF